MATAYEPQKISDKKWIVEVSYYPEFREIHEHEFDNLTEAEAFVKGVNGRKETKR